ncbi:double-strand break repair helicase AddA [Henriciella aquimarina]|uniref:double-strand break repair helicase AddA n=1 Tax=Henriciella aquimarina TaxID=545261 RepID=UPI001301E5B1|nr:double-strand break repair helicase AddA [Henriciella aquimarina]
MSSLSAYDLAQQAQADAARPDRSAWVEAHAGSGKTKVLIDRVARLLLRREDGRRGADPDTILCITYTKAAANEMLRRLFERLGSWSVMGDAPLREALAKLEARSPESYSADDLQAARALFARALETPGGLRIETIHAFCSRILRRFPLEADVSPGFGEIEDREADLLWGDSLKDEVLAAAEHAPEALGKVSEAGGGLGAGAVIASLRGQRTRLTGIDAETLRGDVKAVLDAPDETVEEILDRAVGSWLPREDLTNIVRGLNDLPKRGKSDETLMEALSACLLAETLEEAWAAYSGIFLKADGGWRASNPYTAGAAKDVPGLADLFQMKDGEGTETARIRAILGALIARRAYEQTTALLEIGLPVLEGYAQGKARRAALDFDDLIQRTRALLLSPGVGQWVLYKLDGGLTHILLDEAQDTSPDQWAIINALVNEFRAGEGAERSTDPRTQFTVGDKKQSIYSFQGADPEQFLREKRSFAEAEETLSGQANMPDMTMSFRSTPEVLGFVDTVFNQDSFGGDPFSEVVPEEADLLEHRASRSNQHGRIDLWPIEPHRDEEEGDPWDAPLDHVSEGSPVNRLARKVAAEIKSMIESGAPVWEEGEGRKWARRPARPEDFLILVRKRGALFEALIKAMKAERLPVAGADRLKLLDHIGVQDCLNLIHFALFPGDDLTLAEILRGPFCGLTDDDRDLFALAHDRKKGERLWDRLKMAADPRFQAARAFCGRLLEGRHKPAFDLLMEALVMRQADGLSGWDKLIQRLGEPARDPVNALLDRALGHDMGEAAGLQTFLAEIEGDTSELKRDLAEAAGEIRVMTVHGAKGLQAPIVILPDTTGGEPADRNGLFMVDDRVPVYSAKRADDPPAITTLRQARKTAQARESRRLLYVALTRAQDRLIIGGAFAGRKTGPGYDKESWYALCRTAMLELTGAEAADEPLVWGEVAAPLGKAADTGSHLADAPAWTKTDAPARDTAPRVTAPSRLLTDAAPVSKPFGAARTAALLRGKLIHALLQYLPELPEKQRKAAAKSYLARQAELSASDRDEILTVTLATLETEHFAPLFAPGGRSEAAIVGRLDTPDGPVIINGRVDRLVIRETDILLIDHKTDRPAPARAEDVDASYLMQMAAYQLVLEAAWPGRTVRPALLYTDGPKLHELTPALLQNSRNRLAGGI